MTAHLRTDYIRVEDKKSGVKFTMPASAHNPDEARLLKDAAVDENGAPLPPEFPEAPKSLSSQSNSGQTATTKEGA